MENQSQHRLVLIPPPFQGHINPMLQLGTILHSRGFSITVARTHVNSLDPTKHPNLTFLPFSDGISNSQVDTNNLMGIVSAINANSGTPLKELLLDHMAKANESNEKIACIIYDACLHFIDSVAREIELPTAVLRITNATNLLTHHVSPKLQSNGYLRLQDSMSWELVPELEPLRFMDLPIFKLPNLDAYLQHIADAIAVTPSLGVICNTVDCLEAPSLNRVQQLYKVNFYPIGPLHVIAEDSSTSSLLKEDYSCITWLNNQAKNSVLYVSLGSIASWEEKELTEVACGLANSKQHFLWVIRPGTVVDDVSEWLQSLPEDVRVAVTERGCIVKWAPQREVLAPCAVGGFWSHCGWNSILESPCEGVPMICQPCFVDQRVNARLVSHLEWSNVIKRDEIEGAVRRLMVRQEGKEMLKRAVELKDEIKVAASDGSSIDALNGLVNSILLLVDANHASQKNGSYSTILEECYLYKF